MLDETYLRVTEDELMARFAPVASLGDRARYLTYYRRSVEAATVLSRLPADADPKVLKAAETLGLQMQKDERFWVVDTLMSFYRSPDRLTLFEKLLQCAMPGLFAQGPGADRCRELLGDPAKLELFFEVNLPSPPAYQDFLRANLDSRSLVPWLTERAHSSPRKRLEGTTKVDALLIAPDTGFSVLFEAKVLSDTSCQIRFDAMRNQIARNIDVMLEANHGIAAPLNRRDPRQTCFVLITPELFLRNPDTRLYGWLMNDYQNPDGQLLSKHLPWRSDQGQLDDISQRLGWISWEQCKVVNSDACPWL